jgi:hypothetical protein
MNSRSFVANNRCSDFEIVSLLVARETKLAA